jgi:hypothetical protein
MLFAVVLELLAMIFQLTFAERAELSSQNPIRIVNILLKKVTLVHFFMPQKGGKSPPTKINSTKSKQRELKR